MKSVQRAAAIFGVWVRTQSYAGSLHETWGVIGQKSSNYTAFGKSYSSWGKAAEYSGELLYLVWFRKEMRGADKQMKKKCLLLMKSE